jgi:hypothetical protein
LALWPASRAPGVFSAFSSQANSLLTGLGGISLGGLLPVGLELKIPSLPAQRTTFACP